MDLTGRRLDELALDATAAQHATIVEGWTCKAAPDLPFRRANAVLPAPGAGADQAATVADLEKIERWYHGRHRRVLIQVSSADPCSDDLDSLLAERGYEVEAPVLVMVADAGSVDVSARSARPRPADPIPGGRTPGEKHGTSLDLEARVVCGSGDTWGDGYVGVADTESGRHRLVGYRRMFAGLGAGVRLATVVVHPGPGERPAAAARIAGVGFGVADGSWAGLFGIETSSAWRRAGIGRLVVGALAADLVDGGVDRLYLQVETDNAAAQRLYRSLGFVDHHLYHYRVSAPS